jgi:hypothetical protein
MSEMLPRISSRQRTFAPPPSPASRSFNYPFNLLPEPEMFTRTFLHIFLEPRLQFQLSLRQQLPVISNLFFHLRCEEFKNENISHSRSTVRYTENNIWKINSLLFCTFQSVFRIRIGFNADPEPTFYLSADADPDPGANQCGSMQIRILIRLCGHKSWILTYFMKVGNMS